MAKLDTETAREFKLISLDRAVDNSRPGTNGAEVVKKAEEFYKFLTEE